MLCVRQKLEPVWCNYEGDIYFLVNPLTAEIVEDLKKKCSEKNNKINPVTKESEIVDELNQEKFNDAFIDYVLHDWKGNVIDENENKLPVNLKNKKALMNKEKVNNCVMNFAKEIPGLTNKQIEEQLGN